MNAKLKKSNPTRQMMANRFDAAQLDLNMAITQKDRCIAQINQYGRKFPQKIAIRELKHVWSIMFPR